MKFFIILFFKTKKKVEQNTKSDPRRSLLEGGSWTYYQSCFIFLKHLTRTMSVPKTRRHINLTIKNPNLSLIQA